MPYKLTMIFQAATQPVASATPQRVAGWSESVYNQTLTEGTRTQFRALMQARAACLPNTAAIVGQRYQLVNPVGGSNSGAERFPGTWNAVDATNPSQDIPSAALYCRTLTTAANSRMTILRCLPDDWVKGGELYATTSVMQRLEAYFDQLRGWSMLGRNLAAARLPIFAISDTGLVSFTENQAPVGVGLARITGALDEDQLRRAGTFKVTANPSPSSVQLQGWNYGATTGGVFIVYTPQFYQMTTTAISRVITKKVGRPLFVFRGRRSKRRR